MQNLLTLKHAILKQYEEIESSRELVGNEKRLALSIYGNTLNEIESLIEGYGDSGSLNLGRLL